MSVYKLYYFDAAGLGEPIRLMFAVANVKFEDIRLQRGIEWTMLKPDFPWGKVPVLKVDGVTISQSQTIIRFLAKRFGLSPDDPIELAKCGEYVESIVDVRTEGKKFHRETDPEKKSKLEEEFLKGKFPFYMEKLDTILKENGSGYLVGAKLSFADVFVAYTVEQICSWIATPQALVPYPKVQQHLNKIMSLPGIKEWVAARPKTKA